MWKIAENPLKEISVNKKEKPLHTGKNFSSTVFRQKPENTNVCQPELNCGIFIQWNSVATGCYAVDIHLQTHPPRSVLWCWGWDSGNFISSLPQRSVKLCQQEEPEALRGRKDTFLSLCFLFLSVPPLSEIFTLARTADSSW